jgi:hypothetical protein
MTRGIETNPAWWSSLTHGGLLIAPARLAEYFHESPTALSAHLTDRLRRDLLRAGSGDGTQFSAFIDTVLEDVLGLKASWWTKGSEVDPRWSLNLITGENLKPRRVWHALLGDSGASDFVLPLFVADDGASHSGTRLGVGRGRRSVSRVIEWLRRANLPVAVLTNGRQWRLIHAGADYDAWCEWDTDLWFEEGRPGAQLTALRTILSPDALTPPRSGERPRLVAAILDSRRGQAELSSALGERVRLAVEKLIQESGPSLSALDAPGPAQVSRRELYIAATRIVMRGVVILFAEARDLLPRDSAIYHGCYGIQGLREQLARLAGGRADRLRHSQGAWPRLLALFELIRLGSAHEALPIPAYGGGLFERGDAESKDGVLRAVAAFENPANTLSDHTVHQILELLSVSAVKVRQGRSSTWVSAPVDFSDLSSEYIGILYEGLLDFELRRAPQDDAIVFLRIGDEPALPLSRLEQEMAPRRLAELIGKLKKSTKKIAALEADQESDDEEVDDDETEADEVVVDSSDTVVASEAPDEAVAEPDEESDDIARIVRERAQIWAEKAVREAKLVPYPRRDADPVVRERWNRDVQDAAKRLYRLVLPGQWYLVRWGGTRKGAGTFYTRPQLAVPTVRRTLQPLCYQPLSEIVDESTGLSTVTSWTPHRPEDILALKVCDPAMGSGSFLVSSLRYLTDALVESLHAHGRLMARPDGVIVKLADGLPLDHPSQETLPVPPDHPDFDDRLRARLQRHVVERCIYGVDLDPLAVELARMALWIETMDRRLPFGFLDHKLRCGNALVGAWFDRFQEYPVMAFQRDDAGDKSHERFVSHFHEYMAERGKKKGQLVRSGDVWTRAWKDFRDDVVRPRMREWIATFGPQFRMTSILGEGMTPQRLHDEALAVFRELHDLPVHDVAERERIYRERIAKNPALERLRLAFDTWCAIWFWPGDELRVLPPPDEFHEPSDEGRKVVERVRQEMRFFHWELEFPDVFTGPGSGFDAIVGNPPWETQQPNSKEFFSNIDPLYRTYGKQEALKSQTEYFKSDSRIEHDWLLYSAGFKSFATWNKFVAHPFGDARDEEGEFSLSRSKAENASLHDLWRLQRADRAGYADPEHPFRFQGDGKPYTYKMFVEAARSLLRENGYLGFITPSGIYTDKGSTELRKLLLDRSRWEWLFGFENRQKLFDIDSRFKFNPIIVRKGGQTSAIRTAFMHRAVEDWQEAERHVLAYPRARVSQFSPKSSAILEIQSERDLQVLEKMYRNSVLLGEQGPEGWGIEYRQGDFNMTSDSKFFPPRTEWERKGYRPNEYGMWIGPDGDVALPLYEGRMIGQFDFSEKGWVSGKGRGAVWREIPWENKVIEPQFLLPLSIAAPATPLLTPKVGQMRVGSATNRRTVIATALVGAPCGDKVATLTLSSERASLALLAILDSFVLDYSARLRVGGLQIDQHLLFELAAPVPPTSVSETLAALSRKLACGGVQYATLWNSLAGTSQKTPWRENWAITPFERLRLRAIADAIVAQIFGLGVQDMDWVLRDTSHPLSSGRDDELTHSFDSKGFWRVDKDKDPELRHTVLAQVAFRDLQRLGLTTFLEQNNGEGWMIPETLRLADYGLGHDDRAKEHQPVASRLGPRFLPWQLEQGVEESWEECARHAERIEKLLGGGATRANHVAESEPAPYDAGPRDLFGEAQPTDLFGEPSKPPKGRRS